MGRLPKPPSDCVLLICASVTDVPTLAPVQAAAKEFDPAELPPQPPCGPCIAETAASQPICKFKLLPVAALKEAICMPSAFKMCDCVVELLQIVKTKPPSASSSAGLPLAEKGAANTAGRGLEETPPTKGPVLVGVVSA